MDIRRWFTEWADFHACWLDGGCIIEDGPEFAIFDICIIVTMLMSVVLALLKGRRRNRFRRRRNWIL